ncbi:glycosyltransferase [Rhizobium sp. BK251]|uniref:glycosyltransferase n=1 Tax=Rhizobium sp. BK251 TaxID=2512125 RepID=UPI001042E3C7|nr:glycosyltransferase [Rhizobium sp. BK251]TCL66381.1 glycosyltransferase involved in cell wall biosynthesis [Rhizobium sp. BK251]
MKLVLASGMPYLPQLIGGVEVNTHHAALELNRRGHETSVLSKLSLRDMFGVKAFLASHLRFSSISVDRMLGYEVYRSLKPWEGLPRHALPRVVVIQNGNMVQMARAFGKRGVPSVAYLHGLGFDTGPRAWQETRESLPFSAYVANSIFTANRFKARFGIEPTVIPPIFQPERYRTTGEGRYVTFINPVPVKGVAVALAVAKLCSDIPFLFVRAWPLSSTAEAELQRAVAMLPNVRLIERCDDMRLIYAQTRVLLVPSQCDETWGRVVSEAQISGIPVLSSNAGGLPESAGPGGILLHRNDPATLWADQLRVLWEDFALYRKKREAALAHAKRPDLDVRRQLDQLIAITEKIK